MLVDESFLVPDWPAPPGVRAIQTTRIGGAGEGPYSGFNLGAYVGDDPSRVAANRAALKQHLRLPAEPLWLQQVHGIRTQRLPSRHCEAADASWADQLGQVCVVTTADCLPVLFCDVDGRCVAAAHAGWRGLADGVLEAAVAALPVPASNVMAWLGAAIGPTAFEVGTDVLDRFVAVDPVLAEHFVATGTRGKFYADLYALARARLRACGLRSISGGGRCTYTESDRFFSFRRDRVCGRMASLIWLDDADGAPSRSSGIDEP